MQYHNNYRRFLYFIIAVLFFYSIYLIGRLGYIYELNRSKPEILEISEINPKVCRVWIDNFDNNKIKGHINEFDTRLSYKDKVFLIDEKGNFEIVK